MKHIILTLVLALTVSMGMTQGSDIAVTIAQQTGCSYACVEQAIALGELTIKKKPGSTEICDGFIVVIEGRVESCDGSPEAYFHDKVIWLEDEEFRNE